MPADQQRSEPLLPLALTMGEPAGIGPDIALTAWVNRERFALEPFYLLGSPSLLAARAAQLGLTAPVTECAPEDVPNVFGKALPVVPLAAPVQATAGHATPDNAQAVIEAIARAVGDVRSGLASAVVTNPINKKTLYDAGFRHPGHTEFLGTLSAAWTGNAARPVMMMAGPELKTVPVTIHIPLRDVASVLTEELIVDTAVIVATDMRKRFGLPEPRIALAGLNPHAGENGTMGDEDQRVVAPAAKRLREMGIRAEGPLSADAMFHPKARATYDAALCMYHDQALIPSKTINFSETVNVTLGLAFIRTSPDHGTALSIAGSGKASPSSLASALRLAAELRRNELAT